LLTSSPIIILFVEGKAARTRRASANNINKRKQKYWEDVENRRKFLRAFAEKIGFDPMVRSNWTGMTFPLQSNQVRLVPFYSNQSFLIIDIVGWRDASSIFWVLTRAVSRHFPRNLPQYRDRWLPLFLLFLVFFESRELIIFP